MPNQDAHQSTSVRDVLRLQTNETHQKLHDHASFVGLFDQTLTRDAYRDLMRAFYGFYAPLDAALARATTDLPATTYCYAKRAHLLAQDLDDLGVHRKTITSTPMCDALTELVTPLTLGGVLYVIEGSALGAAPIDRAAQKLLGRDDPAGRQFWAWSRAQNGARWKNTVRYLDSLHASGVPLRDLEYGANRTFELLAQWLAPLECAVLPSVPA